MLKKQSDLKSRLLPTNKPLILTCLYAYMYVSTSKVYMLPILTDTVFMPNVKSSINQSSVTVSSVPPACVITFVRNNVIKKPVTCRDSVMKRPRKCLRKSTIAKNCKAVNYVSEPANNVANCSGSFSTSSSGFVCQPVCFNKFVHKQISSSVVNKPILSVDGSEFCTIFKCENKFYDLWIQFLILFSLLTLNYRYLSCNKDCYYLKANTIVYNLTTYLIFIKFHTYNFSDCLGKIFFKVLFFYSNLYQFFLISIQFFSVCKFVSILSFTKSQFRKAYLEKFYYLAY